jgi:hypothetical protein
VFRAVLSWGCVLLYGQGRWRVAGMPQSVEQVYSATEVQAALYCRVGNTCMQHTNTARCFCCPDPQMICFMLVTLFWRCLVHLLVRHEPLASVWVA